MIYIVERDGTDLGDVIAKWEDGEFFDVDEDCRDYRMFDDPALTNYDRELMLEEFDGPDLFATTKEAWEADQPEA